MILGLRYLRHVLLAILAFLLAGSLAWEITTLSSGPLYLGRAILLSLVPLFLVAATILILATDFSQLSLSFPRPNIGVKPALLLAVIAPLVAYFIISFSPVIGPVNVLLVLAITIGFLFSLYLTISRPDASGLAAFIVTLAFLSAFEWNYHLEYFTGGPWGPIAWSPSLIALFIFFAASVIEQAFLSKRTFTVTSFGKYLLVWVFFLLISSIASSNPLLSFRQFFVEAVVFPLFFLLAVNRVRDRRDGILVVAALAAFGFLRVVLAFYYSAVGSGLGLDLYRFSQSLSIINVSLLGAVIAWTIPLMTGMFLHTIRLRQLFLALAIVFLAMTMVLSEVRASLLAVMLTFPLFAIYVGGKRRLAAVVPILVAGIFLGTVLATTPVIQRFAAWTSVEGVLTEQQPRLDMYRASVRMMLDRPLGIGLGMWQSQYPLYSERPWRIAGRVTASDNPHNFFMHYGSAAGIGALLTLVVICGVVLKRAVSLCQLTRDRPTRFAMSGLLWSFSAIVATGVLGGLGSLMAHSIRPTTLLTRKIPPILDIGAPFWLMVGLIFALEGIMKLGLSSPSSDQEKTV